MVDRTESRTAHDVSGDREIYQIEYIKEFRPELNPDVLTAESGFLHQRQIHIMEGRSSKRITAKRTVAAVVRTRAAGNVYGDGKQRSVRSTETEVVLPHRTARREKG